jgi:hypothetical protein
MQDNHQFFETSAGPGTVFTQTAVTSQTQGVPAAATRYAMIKSAPDVHPDEVERADRLAAEVMILWGANVLHVAHLAPPRVFSVGDSLSTAEAVDYQIPHTALEVSRLPLLVGDTNGVRLVIPEGATGQIELEGQPALSLDEARCRAAKSVDVAGAFEFELNRGTRARLELNGFTFQVALVNAGRTVKKGLLAVTDWNAAGYFGASFMAVGALMAAMAFFVPPMNLMDDEALERDRLYLINAILKSQAEREREQKQETATNDQASDEGGTGERAQGDEGAMGKQTSRATNKHYALKGPADNPDPHLARQHGREAATTFGMIALLSGADPDAPTAPWGRDTSLGVDDVSAQGGMWGDEIGESYGAGGLGLSGIGEGGGGLGEGIGLGDIGIGHGAGLGMRQGFGNGVGRPTGTYRPKQPAQMRPGQSTVSGRLPPEVIQRIVRQNYGRFRMCYEQGLTKNPNLSGRVAVRFAISREGTVQSAQNGGSDLPDSAVVGCVVSAFYGLTFPEPENGIVTVSYPIMFSPG